MPTPTIEKQPTRDQRIATEEHYARRSDGHTIGGLIRELRDDLMTLVSQQFAMGRREISEKFSRISNNLAFLLTGSIVALTGIIFLVQSLTQAVGNWLIYGGLAAATVQWLAPLIVGGTLAVAGFIFLFKAIRTFSHPHLNLDHTMHSLKEDIQWAQKRKR
ncbi:MAG: phage holin family protein [Chitinivibrionales bacterium]